MAYEKQNFYDGQVLNSGHLNHIEDGIIELEKSISNVSVNNIELSIDDIEAGGWGLYDKTDSNTRLRTKELISLSVNDTVSWDIPDTLVLTITVLRPDGATTDISGALYRVLWANGKGSYVATENSQLHFIWAKINTNESITVNDWKGVYSINKSNQSNTDDTDNIVDTKIRKIYKFGGKGNDWCFVYLPPNYDKNRQKPYPFVICNHGNGWTMNGTPSTANWTKRTMYVPLTDSDYKSQPTQFNGTADETLWYSNPTIEKFLSEGYIVCGCQNYADNLYGNDNCRNACAEFYAHMKRTYNVEDRCCMIGASNGAMTTLNACYLLGENVKAIILQYPLACLTKHYFGYSSHQSDIRKVYGITDSNISEEDFIKATRTHDPMHTNMVEGVKIGYFPPTKIYYSTTDTVTSCNNNALPLYEMLNNSLKVVEITQVDKDGVNRPHGDYAHFNPDEYIEWFNRW
jgi:acetyl esterase/lipase